MSGAWPWPADTPLDRARRVALAYQAVLRRADPEACDEVDELMVGRGQDWVVPRLEHLQLDELLPAVDLAPLVGVEAHTIRKWAYRGHLEKHTGVDGTPLYRVGDAVAYQAGRRQQRAAAATRRDQP